MLLAPRSLERETYPLVQAKHQVHRMHGIAGTALEQDIHHSMDGEQATGLVLVEPDQALVGVLDVGGNEWTIDDKDNVMVIVVLLIELRNHLGSDTTLELCGDSQCATLSKPRNT